MVAACAAKARLLTRRPGSPGAVDHIEVRGSPRGQSRPYQHRGGSVVDAGCRTTAADHGVRAGIRPARHRSGTRGYLTGWSGHAES
ncbi:hypothetical protein NKH18_38545 [Streptomyces sp. M10(2022)]